MTPIIIVAWIQGKSDCQEVTGADVLNLITQTTEISSSETDLSSKRRTLYTLYPWIILIRFTLPMKHRSCCLGFACGSLHFDPIDGTRNSGPDKSINCRTQVTASKDMFTLFRAQSLNDARRHVYKARCDHSPCFCLQRPFEDHFLKYIWDKFHLSIILSALYLIQLCMFPQFCAHTD